MKTNGCNCFTAVTKVLTDEGEKNIENIKVGDKVLAKSEFDGNGELAYKEVTALYTNYRNDIIKIYIGDLLIETTDNHPFWVEGRGWVFADELKVGDKLQKADGSTLVIDKVEFVLLDEPVTVYNFTVEDYHTYYVTDLGIWVHNTNCFKLPKTVKSNKGVTGSFSVKGYTYRIDTNKTAPGEGGFHIHIYRNGKEVAKVSGTGSWAKSHNSKTLLKPSQIDKTVRTEVNRLIRHVQKRL